MKTLERARLLAETMLDLGRRAGRRVVCELTAMDEPLGRAVGNALEVREALATLRGEGPPDFTELVLGSAGAAAGHVGPRPRRGGGATPRRGRRRDRRGPRRIPALDLRAGRRSRRGPTAVGARRALPLRRPRRATSSRCTGSGSAALPSTSGPVAHGRRIPSTTRRASSAGPSAATGTSRASRSPRCTLATKATPSERRSRSQPATSSGPSRRRPLRSCSRSSSSRSARRRLKESVRPRRPGCAGRPGPNKRRVGSVWSRALGPASVGRLRVARGRRSDDRERRARLSLVPELPEVETIRSALVPALEGRQLERVSILDPRLTAPYPPMPSPPPLTGDRVVRVGRRGKYVVFELSSGRHLLVHLRMTGSFRLHRNGSLEDDPYRRAVVRLDDGSDVTYRDVRRFGTWTLLEQGELEPYLGKRLGPEPLERGYTARPARECPARAESAGQVSPARPAHGRRCREHLRGRGALVRAHPSAAAGRQPGRGHGRAAAPMRCAPRSAEGSTGREQRCATTATRPAQQAPCRTSSRSTADAASRAGAVEGRSSASSSQVAARSTARGCQRGPVPTT